MCGSVKFFDYGLILLKVEGWVLGCGVEVVVEVRVL